jgi:MFS family permease
MTTVMQDVRLGFTHIAQNPRLLHTVVSFHLVTVMGLSYVVLMPGFAKDVLDAGTAGLGVLYGVAAAGGLVMSVIVASLADSKRAPVYLSVSSFALGVALIFTGVAPTFAVAIVTLIAVGGASSAFQTLNNAIAMQMSEPMFFGRVIGLMFLAWGINSLFSLPIGIVADQLGERTVISGMGLILCFTVLLLALWGKRISTRTPAPQGARPATTPARQT